MGQDNADLITVSVAANSQKPVPISGDQVIILESNHVGFELKLFDDGTGNSTNFLSVFRGLSYRPRFVFSEGIIKNTTSEELTVTLGFTLGSFEDRRLIIANTLNSLIGVKSSGGFEIINTVDIGAATKELLIAGSSDSTSVRLYNNGANPVFVGGAGITGIDQGDLLAAGESRLYETSGSIYGYSELGTQVTGIRFFFQLD